MKQTIDLISLGRHTRLGDALEHALEGQSFQTITAEELAGAALTNRRLLFAASADSLGENADMRALTLELLRGGRDLSGSVCAVIADGEQGGALQLDALLLLQAANGAGAACISRPLFETGRDLRNLPPVSGGGRGTPFERYLALARSLALRLSGYEPPQGEKKRVRLISALESGITQDWRGALARICADAGGVFAENEEAENTILLCENTTGLPGERTLALLNGGSGRLSCMVASPMAGGELYSLALLSQICARGDFSLTPNGITLFDGLSAGEALSGRLEMERVKTVVANLVS